MRRGGATKKFFENAAETTAAATENITEQLKGIYPRATRTTAAAPTQTADLAQVLADAFAKLQKAAAYVSDG